MKFTHDEVHSLPIILSAPRFATYLREKDGNKIAALQLYQWNLEVSAAFFVPLQIAEISVRNAIAEAIEYAYGANWPLEKSFQISLSDSQSPHYSPRTDLKRCQSANNTTGKIIAELKFVFWERMLTRRHDDAIWNKHFNTVFPNTDKAIKIYELRRNCFTALEKIRKLRNRIAHHEPIFSRNIQEEYDTIRDVIKWRDNATAAWVDKIETVTAKIILKP